jgi:Protein of unknown function (DUF3108)
MRFDTGRVSLRVAPIFALAVVCLHTPAAEARAWPTRVAAVYRITFGGFDVGRFHFESNVSEQGYTLSGNAELNALMGILNWQGATRSSGSVAGERPRPTAYTFDFKSNAKSGSVKMSFNAAGVSNVTAVPPQVPSRASVPVRDQHLKDVLDPLSAVMALTRGRTANPCGRKISIFDGKQRFDLALSFRRRERITEAHRSGQPGVGYVCRVRYIPIAGHKNNDETRQMADSTGIEVALRPVPSANLLIPYQITIPTIAGAAVLTSQRVDITTQGKKQIALVR